MANRDNQLLADRVKAIRVARNGDDVAMLAEEIGVPLRTWQNYESGVNIPAHVILQFIHLGANPEYLTTGEGSPITEID